MGQMVEYLVTPIPETDHYLAIIRLCESEDFKQMNHDLRSSLSSILGMIDLTLDNLNNGIHDSTNIYMLGVALKNGNKMANGLNRFLTVSRLSEGIDKPKKEVVKILSFLKEIKDNFDATFSKQGLALIREPLGKEIDFELQIDKGLIQIALESAIRNSAEEILLRQFEDHRKRQIFLHFGRYESGTVIKVSNHCDLSHEDFEKIFRIKFTNKFKGNGLGTNAIKIIIEAHDGTVIASLKNGIITITMKLPD